MKVLLEVKGYSKKQIPQITKLVEEFCRDLHNHVAIKSCKCVEVKSGKQKKQAS